MEKLNFHLQFLQSLYNRFMVRAINRFVTDPVFKEIAKDKKRVSGFRIRGEELQEQIGYLGAFASQVQVGNE